MKTSRCVFIRPKPLYINQFRQCKFGVIVAQDYKYMAKVLKKKKTRKEQMDILFKRISATIMRSCFNLDYLQFKP